LAFLVFSAVAAITWGPSNVMLTATGAIAGVLRGLQWLVATSASAAFLLLASNRAQRALNLAMGAALAGLVFLTFA
jgi:hypothetical protein